MLWYDRNQQKSEYRRKRYEALSDLQREQIRAQKRELYRKRIAEGWHGPVNRRGRDHMIWRELVISMLIQRDGNLCGICTKPVDPSEDSIDHIVPRGMGGPNTAQNIRLTHRTCNNRRPKKPKDLRLLMEQADSSKVN
jgi:5-methylcytosine-specific restriction endonuclease McrA